MCFSFVIISVDLLGSKYLHVYIHAGELQLVFRVFWQLFCYLSKRMHIPISTYFLKVDYQQIGPPAGTIHLQLLVTCTKDTRRPQEEGMSWFSTVLRCVIRCCVGLRGSSPAGFIDCKDNGCERGGPSDQTLYVVYRDIWISIPIVPDFFTRL